VVFAALAGVILGWRLRHDPAGALLACVALGLLANAAATGALSAPFERYQARIIWLLPFAVTLAGLGVAQKMNRL
jgi:hypothetical protein